MISVLQWTSRASWDENKVIIEQLFMQLPDARPQLVVLPEMFAVFGAGEAKQGEIAELKGKGPIQDFIAKLAREHGVWVLAGTMPLKAGERYAAASLLFDDKGEQQGRYDKIHLFDAEVSDGTKTYKESNYVRPGNRLVVVQTPFGRLGLTVCYDLRFPEMFRALRSQGAELIALPSAFTKVTGEAHWESLIRARAIENQLYMIAPNQCGTHEDGRETWGHSMIIDPWGRVLAEQQDTAGVIHAEIDLNELHALRKRMPVQQHNQFEVNFVHDAAGR